MSRYARHNPDEPIRHDWTRPFDHAEDEADCLRDWRRDASAEAAMDWYRRRDAAVEAALVLPGLESTGIETISPLDEPAVGTKPTNQQHEKPINQ